MCGGKGASGGGLLSQRILCEGLGAALTARSLSSERADRITLAPARANDRASSLPNPREAPVIQTTCAPGKPHIGQGKCPTRPLWCDLHIMYVVATRA